MNYKKYFRNFIFMNIQLLTTEFMRLSMPPAPDSCIGFILQPREWMRKRDIIWIEINLN